ncbi:hypothetical protein Taro_031732, partial [Colocasia esculenta]|nr:hypothetical protein [Colocasia esculenta]
MIICFAWFVLCDDSKRCISTLSTLGERVVCGSYGVHVVCVKRQLDLSSMAARLRGSPVWFARVLRGLCVVHVVSVYMACSLTPSVDTSSVGSPRFCVSQARECSGLVPVLGTDEVLSSSWT